MKKSRFLLTASMISAFALSGCSTIDNTIGSIFDNDSEVVKEIDGKRIAIFSSKNQIAADEALSKRPTPISEAEEVTIWKQAGGNSRQHIDNIKLNNSTLLTGDSDVNSIEAGDGNEWDSAMVVAPVVSENAIFTIDARGIISAYNRNNIEEELWQYRNLKTQYHQSGGGLAYSNGMLIATTANGIVTALNAANGALLWQKEIFSPIRSAPRIRGDILLVAGANSQLFAFDIKRGRLNWAHRGIQESTGILGNVSPAIYGNIVIMPYPSGEIFAINKNTGLVLWSDSLANPDKRHASYIFSGAGGNPVAAGGRAFLVSNNGAIAAYNITNGQRIWDKEISSSHTPWLSGEFLYVISNDSKLYAINAADGRVKWISNLSEMLDKRSAADLTQISALSVVNGNIYVSFASGDWAEISANDGNLQKIIDITSSADFISPPVFAGNNIYVISSDAELYEIK